MQKKLIVLAMSLAAFVAVTGSAAASVPFTLKDQDGQVEVGQWLTATSTNTVLTHSLFGAAIDCPHVIAAGQVATNNETLVTIDDWVVGQLVGCEVGGESLTVTEPRLKHLETRGAHEGAATLSFVMDLGPFECRFDGSISLTYGTGSGGDSLSFGGPITSPSEFCEGETTTLFEGTYTLTTTNGAEVWFEEAI